ncbi:MAG: phenylalanine--tRNA ligase subunit beta [Candidatus Nanohaloarchaea archaeon]
MPTIEIDKKEFEQLTTQEFENDKLLTEASFMGAHWHSIDGRVCEVETYPNRPDLLSVEGLARAYRGFFDIDTGREYYHVEQGDIELEKKPSVENVRPHIGGAVIRDLELNEKFLNGLIQLQEKLHETMGRRRDKLAIGLHDLSELEPPFTYKAVRPNRVSFTPLEHEKQMQLGEILERHDKGQKYSWILEDEEKYPVILDSEEQVLSFPPIINNQLTEVTAETTDIFIDVTGKDKETVKKALNILTTALAERGGDIESVEIEGEEMPKLEPEEFELDPEYLRDVSGLELNRNRIEERLEQMKYGVSGGGDKIKVEVPCYRTDVMHQYDLIEDVIIAHRYRNIEPEIPNIDQIGTQKPIEDFTNIVRDTMIGTGAIEALTYIHDSREKLSAKIEKSEEDFVKVENPLSEEYSAVRNLLLPSMLEVLQLNKHNSYPQSFFEAGDVVQLDDSPVGASERRKLCYVETGGETDFTNAREILQVLERDLEVTMEVEAQDKPFFKPERSGKILLNGEKIGFIGEVSETVLENWELEKNTVAFELDLEKLRQER